MIRPPWTRTLPPSNGGSCALLKTRLEIAWPYGGAWNPFTDSR